MFERATALRDLLTSTIDHYRHLADALGGRTSALDAMESWATIEKEGPRPSRRPSATSRPSTTLSNAGVGRRRRAITRFAELNGFRAESLRVTTCLRQSENTPDRGCFGPQAPARLLSAHRAPSHGPSGGPSRHPTRRVVRQQRLTTQAHREWVGVVRYMSACALRRIRRTVVRACSRWR